MQKLFGIQRTLESLESNYLIQLEILVHEELENALHHEELLWIQKARCDWLLLDDRNAKYYHSQMIEKRKNNRIITLKNNNGDWVFYIDEL